MQIPFILVLAVGMVLVARGKRWARWVVSPILLFFAAAGLYGGGVGGGLLAVMFALSAVVFFRHP